LKPDGAIFDSAWRSRSKVAPCSVSELKIFVAAHYLKKRPAIVLLALKMLVDEKPTGIVIYSAPPRETSKRYGGITWELARLYLLDEIPRNSETWLIAKRVRFIKLNYPDVKFLISYADPSAGHSGTIYRAANWKQDGMTDDERKTPRCDYYDARTGIKYGRRGNMPQDAVIERRPRIQKYRFYYPLTGK